MMTLDPEILSAAEAARRRMLERQHELERARADLNHEIRRLHAAGGSMREISEKLGVSHQRVHQIVADGDETASDSVLRRLGGRLRGLGNALHRLSGEARAAVVRSHEEARRLGSAAVEPAHLLLALAVPEAGPSAEALERAGVTPDEVRAAVEQVAIPARAGIRRPSSPAIADATKKAMELALREALHRGDAHIGSEHLLLGLLRGEDAQTAAVLERLGIGPETLRDAIGSI